MRVGRSIKIVVMTFASMLLAVGWLTGTQTGLSTVLSVATRWIPTLRVDAAEGTLLNVRLQGLSYRDGTTNVRVNGLNWRIDWRSMFVGRFVLDRLELEDARLDWETQTERLQNQVRLDRLTLSARCDRRRLTVNDLLLQGPRINMPKAPASEDEKVSLQALSHAIRTHVRGLTLPSLPLEFEVTNARVEALHWDEGKLAYVTVESLLATAERWSVQEVDMADDRAQRLTVRAWLEPVNAWPVQLHGVALALTDAGPLTVDLTAGGEIKGALSASATVDGPASASASVRVELAEDGTPFALAVTNGRWASASARVTNVEANVYGTLEDYRLQTRVTTLLPTVEGTIETQLKGQGSLSALAVEQLDVRHGGMMLTARGRVGWDERRARWDLAVDVGNLDARVLGHPVATRVNGGGRLDGAWQDSTFVIGLHDWTLDGRYGDSALDVRLLEATFGPDTVRIPRLDVAVGAENRLRGSLVYENGRLDVEQTVRAERLERIDPDLRGQLHGTVRVTGPIDTLSAHADLHGTRLGWRAYGIDALHVQANVPEGGTLPGSVRMQAQSLHGAFGRMRDARLEVVGTRSLHEMNAHAVFDTGRIDAVWRGAVSVPDRQWSGTVRAFTIDTPEGRFVLTPQTTLVVGAQGARIGPHCWRHDRLGLCAKDTAFIDAASARFAYEMERLDVSLFNALTGGAYRFDGTLKGTVRLNKSTGRGIQAHADLSNASPLEVTKTTRARVYPAYRVTTLALALDAENDLVRGSIRLIPEASAPVEGDVRIEDVRGRARLQAHLRAPNVSLDALSVLIGDRNTIEGRAWADLRLQGTLQEPMAFGYVQAEALGVSNERSPIRVKDGAARLEFDGRTTRLNGRFDTARGYLSAQGLGQWPITGSPSVTLDVQGERFSIRYANMLWATLSPKLSLTIKDHDIRLEGVVDVPSGRISIAQLPPDTVGVSSDEVLTDARWQPLLDRRDGWVVNSDVKVRLGDRVRFNAFGLRAKLLGTMTAKHSPRGLTLNGQVELKDGKYKAYGQDLQIRRGKLLFSGLPHEPVLDIEAVRNPDSTADGVVSGLRVYGTASAPSVQVFSNPAMSESRALSYLLSGQAPGRSGSDSAMVTSALVGLGASKSGQLIGQIGNAFGIRRLGLDTEGSGQEAKVVLSGYILPDVQLKYGVGLFDSLATWTLRYRMMPQLFLEAVSGTEQALDLLYRFEF